MGLFDRFIGKKPAVSPPPPASLAEKTPAVPEENPVVPAGNVMPRLVEAREKLEAKDLPAALAIYEEVLAAAGERADVLVTISGDLGVNGHLREIIELVAPRYDADRHGPATGLNVLQAYLALRQADAAQHVLDILFALNRPELEERLHGFSNAIADLMATGQHSLGDAPPPGGEGDEPAPARVNMVSISKPIWSYDLESVPNILPAKAGKLRRVAFTQLALPGLPEIETMAGKPEEELGRLSRSLPLWLAETFYFTPHYAPIAIVGVMSEPGSPGHYALLPTEWTTDNLRQVVETTEGGLDYIFTGAIQHRSGDYELILRVWEVRKFRERKQFTARWTPATAEVELAKLHEQIRLFMEWAADESALAYAPPASPRIWLDTLGASVSLFLADKGILARDQLPDLTGTFTSAGVQAASGDASSLAYLTLCARSRRMDLPLAPASVALADTATVKAAQAATGCPG